MKTLDFSIHFPDEQSCKDHFRQVREWQGIQCGKCGYCEQRWCEH